MLIRENHCWLWYRPKVKQNKIHKPYHDHTRSIPILTMSLANRSPYPQPTTTTSFLKGYLHLPISLAISPSPRPFLQPSSPLILPHPLGHLRSLPYFSSTPLRNSILSPRQPHPLHSQQEQSFSPVQAPASEPPSFCSLSSPLSGK